MKYFTATLLLCLMPFWVMADDIIPVKVNGAPDALAENIKLTLGRITEPDLQSFFFSSRITRSIQKSTRALGFYHATFDHQVADETLIISLSPGPVVTWGETKITVLGDAANHPDIKAIIDSAPFSQGERINHGAYDGFKQNLFDLCQYLGYQNVSFERSELHIDLQRNIATPIITMNPGSRYKIVATTYSGSQLNNKVLNSLSAVETNKWYSRTLVAQQYKALLDAGYFKTVDVQPVFDHENAQVTLAITLEDVPQNQYLIGAGFGTDTGPRVTLRWQRPLANEYGHSLDTELELSKPSQEFTARYKIPLDHPLEHFLEWGTGVQNKSIEDTDSQRITSGLNLHSRHHRWQQTLGISLEGEKYRQGREEAQHTTYVLPTASWAYSAIAEEGHEGLRFWLNLQTSTQDLYSDTSFFRAVSGVKYLTPLAEDHSILARLEVGALLSDDFNQVPSSKRFFTGGDQTVRGYEFESLSPRNADGDLIGGDRLNVASLEYRWRIKPKWFLATFVDTGRAYHSTDDDFRTGAGLGVRWVSPIGQVSVSLAVPVNDSEYDGFQIHISMGPSI